MPYRTDTAKLRNISCFFISKYSFILFVLFCNVSALYSQGRHRQSREVFHEVSNKLVVQQIYPEAIQVQQVNEYWYRILDKNQRTLGFAMISTTHCDHIIGYAKATPVMIITDLKGKILNVAILSHWETLSYIQMLENAGFFKSWNGKSLKEARKVEPDGYSGATVTAIAVKKNVEFLLENGTKSLPGR